MTVLGTTYCIGSTGPYIRSYFDVSAQDTQMIFPTVIVLQTLMMPVMSYLSKFIRARV